MLLSLSLLLIVNGIIPPQDDTRFNAVGQVNWYCTATLIAPNTILTAKHCIMEGIPTYSIYFRDGESILLHTEDFYLPPNGDAALGYFNEEQELKIDPIPLAFMSMAPTFPIVLAGAGQIHEVSTCESWVLNSTLEYMSFPAFDDPNGPLCGGNSGDSGGAILFGEKDNLHVVGVMISNGGGTNLLQYVNNLRFNPDAHEKKE